MKQYKIGEKCCICDRDCWVEVKNDDLYTKIFLLTSSVRSCEHITIKGNLIGIKHKEKRICIPCLFLLIGLEDYYDEFYYKLLNNEEAKSIIKLIIKDKKLLNEIAKIRSEGKYIPNRIIEELRRAMKSNGKKI